MNKSLACETSMYLRVNLSHLREHKFHHNFLDTLNPLCSCSLEIESTSHYLLRCPFYTHIRKTLLDGGMGRECQAFYNHIALLLTFKWDMHQSKITSWVRARLSFALIRSTNMCIRGSRKGISSPPVSMDEVESADT